MKHTALSMLLLFGLGFGPALSMFGGGSTYYGKEDATVQQNSGEEDGAGAKQTVAGTAGKKTAENHRVKSCKNTEEGACSGHKAQPAK